MRLFYLSLMALVLSTSCYSQKRGTDGLSTAKDTQTEPRNVNGQEKGGIQWISFEEAIKREAKKPKKIVIDVFTDWCGWCKVMDKETFTDPTVVAYVNANYYAVKLNAERTDVVNFKGKDYKFIIQDPAHNKGYHELAAELLGGKLSYPTLVFMDEKMDMLQAIPGYRKAPEMDMFLKFFGGDHYKRGDYSTFQKNYISPYGQ